MSGAKAAALALGAGLLHTAAFAPTGAWWLQILALALLFAIVERATPRAAALAGALFGLAWLASGLWWLHISMHQFGGIPWLAAALAVALLAAFLSGYYALALGLTARWIAPGRWRVLALVPAWLLAELARASCFSGFPWIASGYAHTVGPLAGWAPWLGVYGICALAALAAAGLVWLKRGAVAWAAPALLVPLAGLLLPQDFTSSTGKLAVSLVQPSIPQDQKFDAARFSANLETLASLIESARGRAVITPESVVPLPLAELDPATLARLPALVRGVLEAEVDGRAGSTPYARWLAAWGLWPLWAATLLALLGLRRAAQ